MGLISQREVERRYNKMLKKNTTALGDKRYYNYTCRSCRTVVRTVKLNSGTIPMLIDCPRCEAKAYCGPAMEAEKNFLPNFGWKRPTLKETYKYRKKPHMLDHILSGGLILTPVQPVLNKNRNKHIVVMKTANVFKNKEL